MNGDGDCLVGVGAFVIRNPRRVGLGNGVAFFEQLSRRQCIVQRVDPLAGTLTDCNAAVGRARGSISNAPGLRGNSVHIRCGQGAADYSCAGCHRAVIQMTRFGNRTRSCRCIVGHHRCIIHIRNSQDNSVTDKRKGRSKTAVCHIAVSRNGTDRSARSSCCLIPGVVIEVRFRTVHGIRHKPYFVKAAQRKNLSRSQRDWCPCAKI